MLQQQQNLGRRFGTLSPSVALAAVRSKAMVLFLVIRYCLFNSSFSIISVGKRELALLCLPSWCVVSIVLLFLAMPRVCLQFVIVVVFDHTHYFLVFDMSLTFRMKTFCV